MTSRAILVVDDNAANAKLLQVILEREGYEVRVAFDADSAFDVLATYEPKLILMDIQLPGIDGLELTRQLKADPKHSGVPIVAVTANAMKGDEELARRAGCDEYVTKPIELDDFLATVERFLSK